MTNVNFISKYIFVCFSIRVVRVKGPLPAPFCPVGGVDLRSVLLEADAWKPPVFVFSYTMAARVRCLVWERT